MGNSAIGKINLGVPAYVTTFADGNLAAGILTVSHNLNAQYLSVTIYDNNDKIIIPDDVTATDANTSTIDLSSYGTIASTWRVVILDTGATAYINPVITTGPAFKAYKTAVMAVPHNTDTLVVPEAESFDTDSCFDLGGTSRFTPTKAGYYYFTAQSIINISSAAGVSFEFGAIIKKNGSTDLRNYGGNENNASGGYKYAHTSGLIYANGTTDFFEMYLYQFNTNTTTYNTSFLETSFYFEAHWVHS